MARAPDGFGRLWWAPPLDTAACRWCGAVWWRLATVTVCPICDRRPVEAGDG